MTQDVPVVITQQTKRVIGHLGVVGSRELLQAAFESGEPVTLTGKLAGEQVYLGHTRQTYDDEIGLETIGFDYEVKNATTEQMGVPIAVYLIDYQRLDLAPSVADAVRKREGRLLRGAMESERRAQEEERELDRMEEDS